MGWLDHLFSKPGPKPTAAHGPANAPRTESGQASWRALLAKAHLTPGFEWTLIRRQDTAAAELITALFTEASATFGNGHVVARTDDERVELRGTFCGAPIRLGVSLPFGSIDTIEMLGESDLKRLNLVRDLAKIPSPSEPADPWSADENQRIFVAKGVFVDGNATEVQRQLATWSSLAAEAEARVLTDMERLDLYNLGSGGIGRHANVVGVGANPKVSDLDDPIAYLHACAELMAAHLSALRRAAPPPEPGNSALSPPPGAAQIPVVCAYCGSMFIVSAGKNTCPNCGAAAQA